MTGTVDELKDHVRALKDAVDDMRDAISSLEIGLRSAVLNPLERAGVSAILRDVVEHHSNFDKEYSVIMRFDVHPIISYPASSKDEISEL